MDFETTREHPFFVYGQGWASCNPDRTFQCYNLKVYQLQVGDVLISLTPRENPPPPPPQQQQQQQRSSTIITTATTTAVTARQVSTVGSTAPSMGTTDDTAASAEAMASRKRRWSAPDQICDQDEQSKRKH